MAMFKRSAINWTEFRKLPGVVEVDFHYSDQGPSRMPYHESMELVLATTLAALSRAHADPSKQYVLFTHGHSTSRRGTTTSRSVVRGVMRSKAATPFIDRKRSIHHYSVFPCGSSGPRAAAEVRASGAMETSLLESVCSPYSPLKSQGVGLVMSLGCC